MIGHLHQFIYKQLDKEDTLKSLKGIFFQVPSGTSFPYIFIGDFISKDVSSRSLDIKEINFSVTIYHREKSQKFAFDVMDKIKNLLQVSNFGNIVLIKILEEKIICQNDGITQQIFMKFKSIVAN